MSKAKTIKVFKPRRSQWGESSTHIALNDYQSYCGVVATVPIVKGKIEDVDCKRCLK